MTRVHQSVDAVTWSADGRAIAWLSYAPQLGATLWTARPDGSGMRQRARMESGGLQLAWLPDGRFIWVADSGIVTLASELLVAGRPTYDSCASLWLVRADGSRERLLRRC